jgi:hypothetical protein
MRILSHHLQTQGLRTLVVDYMVRQPITDGSGFVQLARIIMNYLTR